MSNDTQGFIPLGMTGTTCVIWSIISQSVVEIAPTQFTRPFLKAALGSDFISVHYQIVNDKTGSISIDLAEAENDIITSCQSKGCFDNMTVYGAGVYSVDGGIVVNAKTLTDIDGKALNRISKDKDKSILFERKGVSGISLNAGIATEDDRLSIIEVLKGFSMANESDYKFLSGFITMSLFPSLLSQRPSVFLSGQRGCGKTVSLDFLKSILGDSIYNFEGPTTGVGINQKIAREGFKSFIFDEFESEHASTAGVLRMSTSWYSTSNQVVKGTINQTAKSLDIKTCGIYAAIDLPVLNAANTSRSVQIEMVPRAEGSYSDIHEMISNQELAASVGMRIKNYLLHNFGRYERAITIMRTALIALGYTARASETVGTLLAGHHILVSLEELTGDSAVSLAQSISSTHFEGIEESSDQEDIFNLILDSKLISSGNSHIVSRLILTALNASKKGSDTTSKVIDLLEETGIKIVIDSASGTPFIAIADSFAQITNLLTGSKFKGKYSKLLMRLPSARSKSVRMNGTVKRCTLIPVPYEILSQAKISVAKEVLSQAVSRHKRPSLSGNQVTQDDANGYNEECDKNID